MATHLEKRFKKAVWLVRNGPPANSSNDTKLAFYAHFKQATEGDNAAEAPFRVQFEARAKWEAWEALKGMSKEEAMQAYIDLVAAGEEPLCRTEHTAVAGVPWRRARGPTADAIECLSPAILRFYSMDSGRL